MIWNYLVFSLSFFLPSSGIITMHSVIQLLFCAALIRVIPLSLLVHLTVPTGSLFGQSAAPHAGESTALMVLDDDCWKLQFRHKVYIYTALQWSVWRGVVSPWSPFRSRVIMIPSLQMWWMRVPNFARHSYNLNIRSCYVSHFLTSGVFPSTSPLPFSFWRNSPHELF